MGAAAEKPSSQYTKGDSTDECPNNTSRSQQRSKTPAVYPRPVNKHPSSRNPQWLNVMKGNEDRAPRVKGTTKKPQHEIQSKTACEPQRKTHKQNKQKDTFYQRIKQTTVLTEISRRNDKTDRQTRKVKTRQTSYIPFMTAPTKGILQRGNALLRSTHRLGHF